jgi:hypothetical protein
MGRLTLIRQFLFSTLFSTFHVSAMSPRRGSDARRPVGGAQRRANPSLLVGFPYCGFQDIWIEAVLNRIRSLEAGGEGRNRVNQLSFGNYCSPICSPDFITNSQCVSLQEAPP